MRLIHTKMVSQAVFCSFHEVKLLGFICWHPLKYGELFQRIGHFYIKVMWLPPCWRPIYQSRQLLAWKHSTASIFTQELLCRLAEFCSIFRGWHKPTAMNPGSWVSLSLSSALHSEVKYQQNETCPVPGSCMLIKHSLSPSWSFTPIRKAWAQLH